MAALEAASDGFCVFDRDDRLVYFNQRYRDVYPKHAKFLRLGERFEDMLRAGVKRGEFADAIGREEEWISHRVSLHQNPEGPIEQRLSDGRWLRIEEKKTCFGDIVGLRSDITDLKRVEEEHRRGEERFRDFADAAGDWLWEMDADLRFTYFSENVERIVGVPAEWHYGKTREDILGADADLDLWKEHLETLRDHQPFRDFEYHRVGPGVEPKWLSTSGKPIFGSDGSFLGYRGCASDVTERKQAEDQLRQSEAKLQAAQKMEAIGRLTGGVAHDFNNLMQVIMGNAEILANDPHVERECIEAIIRATCQGADLTGRLLSYARKQTLAPKQVDIDALLSDLSGLLKRTLGESIEISVVNPIDLWRAFADPNQLETALLNLALNARDAMPRGGRLTFECSNLPVEEATGDDGPRTPAGNYVVLSVSDTGTGMTKETEQRAIEPFFTTKGIGEGSGLGLSMVYGFANQSLGQLRIKTSLGKGTTVSLLLPAAEASVQHNEKRRSGFVDSVNREVVLIVEDNLDVSRFTARVLTKLNYSVLAATNVSDAIQLFSDNPGIDLVLSDIGLPGSVDGYGLSKKFRTLRPDLRIGFMSGYPLDELSQNEKDAEQHLLCKPFSVGDLSVFVRKLLAGQ